MTLNNTTSILSPYKLKYFNIIAHIRVHICHGCYKHSVSQETSARLDVKTENRVLNIFTLQGAFQKILAG